MGQRRWARFFAVWVAIAILLSSQVFAKVTVEGQLRGLEAVLAEIETHYGMLAFKEKLFGVSVESVRQKYSRLIREAKTVEEDLGLVRPEKRKVLSREQFEQILIALAAEFRDGHFNILRGQSRNFWTVGIYAMPIDGQYVVTGFDDKIFVKGASLPEVKVGDRILAINGESVDALAKRFEPGISLATYNSRLNYAYRFLLSRSGRWVPSVKTGGEVRIRFQRPNPNYKEDSAPQAKNTESKFTEFEGLYHWVNSNDYTRARSLFPFEDLKPASDRYVYGFSAVQTHFSEGVKSLKDGVSILKFDEMFNQEIKKSKEKADALKKEKPDAPRDEVFPTQDEELQRLAALEEVSSVPVYILRYEGKQIGVIRIPDYSIHLKEVRWLSQVVERLNALTDVLVIDQVHNGGGYVWTGAQVARLFVDRGEFQSISMNMKLNSTLLNTLESWAALPGRKVPLPAPDEEVAPALAAPEKNPNEDLMPTPNFAQLFLDRKHLDGLQEKFDRGEEYSGFYPYFGVQDAYREGGFGRIVGREGKVYTKPVLVLNDCHSASCGDFFPSMMQANGRALVMGETSMGLGAPVYRSQDSMPGSEMFMRCPFGDCLRPDNLPIENIGAVPDLPRWVTASDLKDSFKAFARDALDAAVLLAEGKTHDEVKAEHMKRLEKKMPTSATFKAVKAEFDLLKTELEKATSSDAITSAYDHFFEKFPKLEVSKLSEEEWAWLPLALPSSLLERDAILMSLRRPDEILDRLSQLKKLKLFGDPNTIKLLQYLEAKLPQVSKSRRPVCFDAMKRLPEYRAIQSPKTAREPLLLTAGN